MKNIIPVPAMLLLAVLFCASCNSNSSNASNETPLVSEAAPSVQTETVIYSSDTITMNGFVAIDKSSTKKRPVILIVHEWWGLNHYIRNRAKQLAELGYLAFAVDMYGNGAMADNPEAAGKMSGAFYKDPAMAKKRFDAALAKAKTFAEADTNQIAAIGYCFGGAQVINMAKLGENLKGVVSFHGGLTGVPVNKDLLRAPMLICHGADDKFVSETEVAQFKKQMDLANAVYTFIYYPGATHAFTNPDATKTGERFKIPIAYNAAADTGSWNDMKVFFSKIF